MLALVLKWLTGGVLDRVLDHLEANKQLELGSEKLKSEITIQAIQQELATRELQADVIKAKLSHRIAWLPMTIIEFGAAFIFLAMAIDLVFQLPGDVAEPSTQFAALLGTVFAGMFITRK